MKTRISELAARIASLERELEKEWSSDLDENRRRFQYTVEKGRVAFDCGGSATSSGSASGSSVALAAARLPFFSNSRICRSTSRCLRTNSPRRSEREGAAASSRLTAHAS